jgi:NAD(P)-dependent dehydrogenase (short-subunit alcohol dehydrogenase family)
MEPKTILVTGASDGIGKETAKTLAKLGHHVIMHGRNPQKTEAAFEEIKKESGNNHIEMYLADFLSLANVKSFADQIIKNYSHLDVLINNAGAQYTDKREITSEGHEKTMVVNVFAPMLLTTLLLKLLGKSKSARVVTVSSASHMFGGRPNLNDIELENKYSMTKAYALSKLYIIWIMQHFVEEAKNSGIKNITFNTVHPGSTKTSLGREAIRLWKQKIFYFLWQPMMISINKAAASSIRAAVSPDLEGVTGKYFGPKKEEKPAKKNHSPENEKKLWEYAMQVIGPYLGTDMVC